MDEATGIPLIVKYLLSASKLAVLPPLLHETTAAPTFICFENGVEWIIEIQTNNFISLPRWYVLGTNGSMVVEDWDLNGRIVTVLETGKNDCEPIVAGAGITRTMAPRTDETMHTVPLPAKDYPTDWDSYYLNLIHALHGEGEILVTHDQQRLLVRVIEAIFKSAEAGEVVHL